VHWSDLADDLGLQPRAFERERAELVERVLTESIGLESALDDLTESLREGVDRRIGDEHAGRSVHDCFRRAAGSERHDGTAAGLRLDRDHAEVLDAGQQRCRRVPVQIPDGFVRLPPQKADVGSGQGLEPVRLGTASHDGKGSPQPAAGVDGHVDALVRHQGGHDQET